MADPLAYEITGPANNLFGVIDLNTGIFTSVGSTGQALAGLGSYGGVIYGAAYRGNTLYSVNTSTGALTIIGNGNIAYGDFGSTTAGLYAFGLNGDLYSINPATGVATDIGPTGLSFGGVVMGMSSGASTLYLTQDNSLYSLNTTNAHATLIGTTNEGESGFGALVSVGDTLYGGAYGAGIPDIYTLDPQSGAATFVTGSPSTPFSPGVAGFWGMAPVPQTQAEIPVTFNSVTATFYQTYNGNWLPSQLIDGITAVQGGPNPPANGWAIYQNNGQSDQTYGETALLTLASPVTSGQHTWTITLYQNYGGGHLLGDFSLGYSTDATPTLSSTDTPFTVIGASSLNGTTFTSLGEGQLLAGGPLPSTDVYTITLTENSPVPITGIFLNLINDPSNGLPSGGPGRFPGSGGGPVGMGNFVVTELTAEVTPTTTYDVAHDFNVTGVQSASGNPFTYGTETSLNVGFTLLPYFSNTSTSVGGNSTTTDGTVNNYYFAQPYQFSGPTIAEVATGNTLTFPSSVPLLVPDDVLVMAPGSPQLNAPDLIVTRFTAPSAGIFDIAGSFADLQMSSVDLMIVVDGKTFSLHHF